MSNVFAVTRQVQPSPTVIQVAPAVNPFDPRLPVNRELFPASAPVPVPAPSPPPPPPPPSATAKLPAPVGGRSTTTNRLKVSVSHEIMMQFPMLRDAEHVIKGHYVTNIKSTHQDVFWASNVTIVSQLLTALLNGTPVVCMDMLNMVAEVMSPLVWRQVVTPIRAFFDFERYVNPEPELTNASYLDATTRGWQTSVFNLLRSVMPSVQEGWIFPAQCHRLVIKSGKLQFKISCHFVVIKTVTTMTDLANLAATHMATGVLYKDMDKSVYSANRKLRLVFSPKNLSTSAPMGDAHVMMPGRTQDETEHLMSPFNLAKMDPTNYMVQHVTHSDLCLAVPATLSRQLQLAMEPVRREPRATPAARQEVVDLASGDSPGTGGPGPATGREFLRLRAALKVMGFNSPRQMGVARESTTVSTYMFTADNRTPENPCPCCALVHDNNNWHATVQLGQGSNSFLVRNFSAKCTSRSLQNAYEPSPFVTALQERGTSADLEYAEVYLRSPGGQLLMKTPGSAGKANGTFLVFNGAKWTERKVDYLWKVVRDYILEHLDGEQRRLKAYLDAASPYSSQALIVDLKEIRKLIKKAQDNLGMVDFVNKVVRALGDLVVGRSEDVEFDNNPNIIHLLDGAFDLETGILGPTLPEHYNRNCLNFNFNAPDADLCDGDNKLNDMLTRVFPDPGARKMFQISIGIAMSGRGDCKKVWVLADMVQGNNGKSMLMQLVQLMLWDYAARLPAAVLTGARNNGEGASAFTHGLKSKRWAATEEVGNGQQVNASRVKEMTPGLEGSGIATRGLYGAPEVMKITWKLMFSANKGQFRFPNDDDAFKKRLVVIMFAVTFTSDATKVNPPFVQFENKELLASLTSSPGFMPAFFRWAAEGYKVWSMNMNVLDDDSIPQSCRDFKAQFLAHNDPVIDILTGLIFHTADAKDELTVADILASVRKDKAIKTLNPKTFSETLKRHVTDIDPHSWRECPNKETVIRGFKYRMEAGPSNYRNFY